MVHPDRILDEAGLAALPPVEPVYGLTEGLFPRVLAKAAAGALARLPHLPEWQDEKFFRATGWLSFGDSLARLHHPQTPQDLAPEGKFFARLAYDELLSHQLSLRLVRAKAQVLRGRAQTSAMARWRKKILAALPFALTGDQTKAVAEISADLASDKRMLRLLQGDVGSGKTVVALLAMAHVIEAGRQAALMAPTEILARQHFATHQAAGRGRGPDRRADDRTRQGGRAARDAGRAGERRARHRDRHPRPGAGRRRLRAARPRRDRRAAPLRRASASRAGRKGRGRGCAGDDRDADPAHAGSGLFRRHGTVLAARKAAGPPADRHARDQRRAHRRSGRRPGAGDQDRRAGLLGLPAGRGQRGQRPRRRAGPRRGSAPISSARRSASSTAR